MTSALLLLALLQQGGPAIMVGVDRDRVAPGDVVTFTIRVSSGSSAPIRVDLPSLGGFELESRAERSDVTTGPAAGRTTIIELTLRATTPGDWRLGPVNVRQGSSYAQSDPVEITIESGAPPPVTANLSPPLARLVQRAPPPRGLGQAGITVAVSDSSAVVGEQVDVVTIAWFDRAVRQQLRRAPTVESPRLEGVWSYPQPVPGGIAASRQVNGKWYDLFVLHQVAFPLTPGTVKVSAARLQYSVPLAFQFFSQEERYKLESEPTSFEVRGLPAAGRQPDYAGAVGRGLSVSQSVSPPAGRQGEAFNAEVVVKGEGNVALWPQPDLRWPASVRVYPEAAEERVNVKGGRLAGAKIFRFLLLADSAGAVNLPAIRYPYFDPGTGQYELATTAGTALVVAPRGDAGGSRAEPPPIRLDSRRPLALAVERGLPAPLWWLVLILPAVAFGVLQRPRRRPAGRAPAGGGDPAAEAERRLDAALRAVLPRSGSGADGALAGELRRIGIDPGLADDLSRLRDRLRAARYAQHTAAADPALLRAVDAAVARLAPRAENGGPRWRRRTGLPLLLLAALTASGVRAQAAPEQLYEAGAYRAAAEGFRRRAVAAPEVPTHWFNQGNAAYRAGDDAMALAAWIRSARLIPRDPGVRRALLLLPPADAAASRWLWVSPVTPSELWFTGGIAWLAAWAGMLWSRRLAGRWLVLLGGALVLLGTGTSLSRWYQRPVAVVASNTQLRLSPHELAPSVGEVPHLGAVRIEVNRGAWARVEAPGGQVGWIPREELASLASPGRS